ncbi:DNA primase [Rhodothalassium salexigens DSM 2132]|uniref:DNA primase n=2 Tax=Rhodothalassium salexigens TaxID=1086 RepID=A0A4R2PHB0_RHOSA|nr:DNA primase [Rhodothalassium salexigens]MBB4211784.1 DNA primase [Rhodothalassium salexigens DSM 2132]TCP33918.1 DNA primase [Rhodothalassium salexigens DSM 2132]
MRFPPRFLDEIRERVPLADVIGRSVKLVRAGREYKGLCPFHNEKTPSFHVIPEKGFYHCFGCGASGDVITFLTDHEGLSFPEAVERLAAEAGLDLPKPDPETERREARAASLHDVMETAARWYQAQLTGPGGREARAYLDRRGVSAASVEGFRLGVAPAQRTALKEALSARGVSEGQMVEAGLLIRPEDGGAGYDRFRNRLMFPIADGRGRVIAFGGRALDGHAKAKYLNSPETPLFHKGHALYNLDKARRAAHDAREIVVVEGYMDVIALADAGIAQAVAPLGTALTPEQLTLLWRLVPEPVLCFDGDSAGLRAAHRAIERALPVLKPGASLSFALLPEGQDPDDLVRRSGPEAMRRLLDRATPLVDLLWRFETAEARLDTPERRAGAERQLFAKLAEIEDEKVRHFYHKEIGARFRRLFRDLQWRQRGAGGRGGGRDNGRAGGWRSGTGGAPGHRALALPEADRAAQMVLLTLLNHPALLAHHDEQVAALRFADAELNGLKNAVLDAWTRLPHLDRTHLRAHLSSDGWAETVARLDDAPALAPVWQARPDAALADAELGLTHAMTLVRSAALRAELDALSRTPLDDLTSTDMERMRILQTELASLSESPPELRSFGVASGRESS